MEFRGRKYLPRPRGISPFSYALKFAPGIQGLDRVSNKDPVFDQSAMSATGILASTFRDREGDVLEVVGIDTTNHRRNPIVLLDHGLYYPLPIGKTADAEGNYLVTIDEKAGDCIQTTYFSQSSEVAEQVFHLYCEGILKANSIGYRALQTKPLSPTGKHILRCELIEATWCGIPCNPDAVTATLSRDKIQGRPLAPAIKAMLAPYAPAKRTVVAVTGVHNPILSRTKSDPKGAQNMAKTTARKGYKDEPMSAADETRGGALRKEDEPAVKSDAVPNDPAMANGAPESDEPLGAEVLRNLHGDLATVIGQYAAVLKKVEKEPVQEKVASLLEALQLAAGDINELFAELYPDLDALEEIAAPEAEEPAGDSEPGEKADEPEEEEKSDDGEEAGDEDDQEEESGKSHRSTRGKARLRIGQKRLTKSQASTLDEAKEFLKELTEDESLGKTHKMALKYIAKALDEMTAAQEAKGEVVEDKDDDLSDEDQKAIKTLERAVARRERLINRLGR